MLQSSLAYAKDKGAALGKQVNASLTTNATLLREEVIDWMVENDVGVTVSIDGAREQQDKHRVFSNGMGSYDIIVPRIKMLLERHKRRPVGARVTLTGQNLDVASIYKHLYEEIGFWEVGFAPVTTSWQREYAIENEGFQQLLGGFQSLAQDYLARRARRKAPWLLERARHARGSSQGHEQGVPVRRRPRTDGRRDGRRCRALSSLRRLGRAQARQRVRRRRSLAAGRLPRRKHHIANKTDCATCWARPLCAGGCYHEAHTRYGSTLEPNLHYCEWIRAWTNTCLEVYGTLAERKPEFLMQFD